MPLEVRRFQDTVLGRVAIRDPVRNVVNGPRHANVVVVADAGLVNLILPIGPTGTAGEQRPVCGGRKTSGRGHVVDERTVLVGIEDG